MTQKEQIITEEIQNVNPGFKIDQVSHYGLNRGWQAFIHFYCKEDDEWYEECVLLGNDIDQVLNNIKEDTTDPPLKSLI